MSPLRRFCAVLNSPTKLLRTLRTTRGRFLATTFGKLVSPGSFSPRLFMHVLSFAWSRPKHKHEEECHLSTGWGFKARLTHHGTSIVFLMDPILVRLLSRTTALIL